MRPLAPLLLSLLLMLVGCAPNLVIHPFRAAPLALDGPAPDVVVLSISGRCAPPCVSPRDNWDYLSSRGTLDRLADTISAAGYRVQVAGYASHPAALAQSPYLATAQRGFESLLADFDRMNRGWLGGPRPPRVVMLAHSHGVVWSHLLTRRYPQVPFALQIDLDGICVAWGSDYGAALRDVPAPPEGLPSARAACDKVNVKGRGVAYKDIVWPNVARNLEVQSKRLPSRTGASGGLPVNYLFELSANRRLDGTTGGLERFVSAREDHGAVTRPGSDALNWVTARTNVILQTWKTQDAALSPSDRPDAHRPDPSQPDPGLPRPSPSER
ncbi:hypothetical protein [Deinococcus koreensis]|uniref:hypothetical protein n=1 Tax=Deinococcus koreensis TaxID=2054903 RepID=UPI001A9CFEE0|nr:hypothetical protein [Deinococcus koreensis]